MNYETHVTEFIIKQLEFAVGIRHTVVNDLVNESMKVGKGYVWRL